MIFSRVIAIAGFVAAMLAAAGVEMVSRRPGSKFRRWLRSSASSCGYRAGRMPIGRIAVYGFWWWLGWHFLAR